jgi:hypothetical protein
MSEVDRLSNSGLYPALPISDRHPSGSGAPPGGEKRPPDKPKPQAGASPDPATPRPPKSLIDEYA